LQRVNAVLERGDGAFSSCFTLPANASRDRIDVSFRNGLLPLKISKLERSKPTTVGTK
jgi:HSP20 family molecular chaperone IbpA